MHITNKTLLQNPIVIEDMLKITFKESERSANKIIYAEKPPELLRWNEARVEVMFSPRHIKVVGPGVSLSWLYKTIQNI
jgi:hypothetical protein